jgi:hypothetical protein
MRVVCESFINTKRISITFRARDCVPVVLYECGTWCVKSREELILKVFEKTVLKRISGRKRVKVAGEWRRLYSGELRNLYSSPNIIR